MRSQGMTWNFSQTCIWIMSVNVKSLFRMWKIIQPDKSFDKGPFIYYVTLFWLIFDPLSPLCHFVTLARTPPPPPVWCDIYIFPKIMSLKPLKTVNNTKMKLNIFWKNVTWHFGWPPSLPLVIFGGTVLTPTPQRVSRIIWMAPNTLKCEFRFQYFFT